MGRLFRVTTFGESHGRCVGVVVDGCPAGLSIKEEIIQRELDRRRPGQSVVTTSRAERDRVGVLSGVFRGFTTGTPICMLVWNKSVDSSEYKKRRFTPRPGHADYTAFVKYGGFNDYRGGGRFSGRITASYVMAGAVAKRLLEELNIEILAHTIEIGGVRAGKKSPDEIRTNREGNLVRCADPEAAGRMVEAIKEAKAEGDSLGGIVECIALNVPAGLGEPVFDTLEGDLSKALFSIPAVKGVEFGAGFSSARLRGSQSNDPFILREGKVVTETNRSGGILGGISNGMPIVCRVAVKPTSSIEKPQRTVNLTTMTNTTLEVRGRHDPCIVPRVVPVVESVVAIVMADHVLRAGMLPPVIGRG
ncbi:MAG: chorismate synthase [Candidatus Bathyarchaeia archaeon]